MTVQQRARKSVDSSVRIYSPSKHLIIQIQQNHPEYRSARSCDSSAKFNTASIQFSKTQEQNHPACKSVRAYSITVKQHLSQPNDSSVRI